MPHRPRADVRAASASSSPGATPSRSSSTVVLWLVGLSLRPDYWCGPAEHLRHPAELHRGRADRDRPHLRHRRRRHRSVGRLGRWRWRARAAAYCVKVLGLDPGGALVIGLLAGSARRASSTRCSRSAFGLPAFIATLGMFYIARGVALVDRRRASSSPASPRASTCIGRKVGDILAYFGIPSRPGLSWRASAEVVSVQTLWMLLIAVDRRRSCLAYMPFGQKLYATGGNRRAADYAGINTKRVRFIAAGLLRPVRDHGRASSTSPISAASTRSPASSASSTASRRSSSAAARSSAATAPSSARWPAPRSSR